MRGMKWTLVLTAVALAAPAAAKQARLDVRLDHPVMMAGEKNKAYLKVGLTGFEIEDRKDRTAVNVAIVIDKSGSMSGEKIQKAKEAARLAVERMGKDDIVSVIAYDTSVQVLVPATKAADKQAIYNGIARIAAGGNTALFAGVSKGADEVRKFLDRNRVNRVILLSDGLANVGPSQPGELAALGGSLIKEGISVTTLGLGLDYNEDLMQRLARASDGNHAFVEQADDLARFFNLEFGDVMAVVAQDVDVEITCGSGVRPVRVLGRDADIVGQKVHARLNQLISGREKFIMLEVEVPPGEAGGDRAIADVRVRYRNTVTQVNDEQSAAVRASFTSDRAEVERRADKEVIVSALELVANDRNEMAVLLRDQGKVDEARRVLQDNATWLDQNASRYNAPSLKKLSTKNVEDSKNLEGESWKKQRKEMRRSQHQIDLQQSY